MVWWIESKNFRTRGGLCMLSNLTLYQIWISSISLNRYNSYKKHWETYCSLFELGYQCFLLASIDYQHANFYKHFIFFKFFNFFNFLNFKIFNSYMHSQTWTPLPPPSPQHLSGSSPCTSSKHAVSCIRHRLAIQFLHDSIHVRMPFSQIIPPSLSPSESKSALYTSASLLRTAKS